MKAFLSAFVFAIIFLTDVCYSASISELKEGEFSFNIISGQRVNLLANKAKISEILKKIYDQMNVDVTVEESRGKELVTITLTDIPLEDVLKKILRDNYAIVFRKANNETIVSGAKVAEKNKKVVKANSYIFPIRPGMKEWEKFETVQEMYQTTQIPEDILRNMDTDSLITTCLSYPLLGNMISFDNIEEGFNELISNFNGLRELIDRNDVGSRLLSEYRQMDPEQVVRQEGKLTPEQEGEFFFKFACMEMLLGQDKILSGMSSADRQALVKDTVEKFEKKSQYPDYYGFLGLSPPGLVMKRAMEKENFIKPDNAEVDAQNIEQILSDSKRFLETK